MTARDKKASRRFETVPLGTLGCLVCSAPCDQIGAVFGFDRDANGKLVLLDFCSSDHAKAWGSTRTRDNNIAQGDARAIGELTQ